MKTSLLIFVLFLQNSCTDPSSGGNISEPDSKGIVSTLTPKATGTMERNKVIDREQLANRVESVDKDIAGIIKTEGVELLKMDTPFLKNGAVYEVVEYNATDSVSFYVGIAGEEFTAVLNANERGFKGLAQKSVVTLDSNEFRIGFAKLYLRTVIAPNERLQVLNSAKEIKPRPNLDEDQTKKFTEFLSRFENIVVPPKVTDIEPYKTVIFAVLGNELVNFTITFAPDTGIETEKAILESDLLIPYTL